MADLLEPIDKWLETLSWPSRLAAAVVPYAASLVGMVLLAQRHSAWLLLLAAILMTGAVLWLQRAVEHPAPPPFAWHVVLAETAMLLGGAGLVIWARAGHPDGVGFIAVVTLFVGVGEIMAALRQPHEGRHARLVAGLSIAWGCAIAFGLALAHLSGGARWPVLAMLLAVVVLPVGIELLSEEIVDSSVLGSPKLRRVARWGGLGAVALGCLLLLVGGAGWLYAVAAVIALFLLVGAIASDTNADVVAVVLIALVVFGNTPSPAPLPAQLVQVREARIIRATSSSCWGTRTPRERALPGSSRTPTPRG